MNVEDIHINDIVYVYGNRFVIVDFAEYDNVVYAKLSDGGILIPILLIEDGNLQILCVLNKGYE